MSLGQHRRVPTRAVILWLHSGSRPSPGGCGGPGGFLPHQGTSRVSHPTTQHPWGCLQRGHRNRGVAVLGGPVRPPLAPSADEAIMRLKCRLSLLPPVDGPTPLATQAPSATCARLAIQPWFPSRSWCQGRSVHEPQPGPLGHLRNPCSPSGPRGWASEPHLRAERGRWPISFSFLACPRVLFSPVNTSADPESTACLLKGAREFSDPTQSPWASKWPLERRCGLETWGFF